MRLIFAWTSQFQFLGATKNMHKAMTIRVIRALILFFDSNPSGTIATRFTKDMTIMDNMFPGLSIFCTMNILRIFSVCINVIIVNPYLIPVGMVALGYCVYIYKTGIRPMIECQRFDQLFYGPINSAISLSINGLVTLRSYRKFDHFEGIFKKNLEKSGNSTFSYNLVNRWIGVRLDMMCALFGTVTCLVTILSKSRVDPKLLVVSIQIVTDIIVFFSITVRFFAEIQNMMTSSQRIVEYTRLDIEDELDKDFDKKLKDQNWPSEGSIKFDDVSMRYNEGLEPAMNDLSLEIQPGMKVGIVGRTGAGKSTILQVLFRLTDSFKGTIMIDGHNIKDIGLHMLRKSIAYIPQAPFLLQGSIRENLDPFNEYTDEEINQTLKEIKLLDHINKNCSNGIQTMITESNNVFSLGQKQLLCLGRAIIRKTKILVLDEATANVDLQTDNFIQEKLKTSFKDCTVLVIAHRLATIIDSDRVLVMDKGRNMEFDHPFKLLAENE